MFFFTAELVYCPIVVHCNEPVDMTEWSDRQQIFKYIFKRYPIKHLSVRIYFSGGVQNLPLGQTLLTVVSNAIISWDTCLSKSIIKITITAITNVKLTLACPPAEIKSNMFS